MLDGANCLTWWAVDIQQPGIDRRPVVHLEATLLLPNVTHRVTHVPPAGSTSPSQASFQYFIIGSRVQL